MVVLHFMQAGQATNNSFLLSFFSADQGRIGIVVKYIVFTEKK